MKMKKEAYENLAKLGENYYGLKITPEFIDKHFDIFFDYFPNRYDENWNEEEDANYTFQAEAESGGIFDTAPRDIFSDVLAIILTDGEFTRWPLNMDSPEYTEAFSKAYSDGAFKFNLI